MLPVSEPLFEGGGGGRYDGRWTRYDWGCLRAVARKGGGGLKGEGAVPVAEVEAFGEGDDLAVGVVCDGVEEFAVVFGVAVGVVVAVVVAPFVDVVAVPPEAIRRCVFHLDAVLAGAEVAVAVFLRIDQGGGDPVSVSGDFFLDVFWDGAVDADAYVPFALPEAFKGAFDFVEAVFGFEGAVGVPFGVVEVVGGEQSGAVGEVVEADGAGLVVFFDGGASGVGGGAVVHAEFVGAGVLAFRGGGVDHGLRLDHVAVFDGLHVFAVEGGDGEGGERYKRQGTRYNV